MSLQSINPHDGSLLKEYNYHSEDEINAIIDHSARAFENWRLLSFPERGGKLLKAAEILRLRRNDLSRLMALEMGKPFEAGRSEIDKCADVCEYYARNASAFLQDELIPTDASKSYVTYQPLGAILAVMPWNFPFWQVFRFLAPTLMAGNCGILKHASNVSGCALEIEKILNDAGFPENVFRTILVAGSGVNKVIDNPHIKAISLTGSTQAGKKVAEKAGSVLKKTVLELGGSDPYIILEDADLKLAAETCANSRLINSGQSCIAAKRFIVSEKIAEEFSGLFRTSMESRKLGDPLLQETNIGPLARKDLREELHQQVVKSIELGAELLLGGKLPEGKGYYYPPTILTKVKKGMPAYDEELFGPVAAVMTFTSEEEAIMLANDSSFGLGAAVFTANMKRGEEIAARLLHAGSCFVNAMVKSDARLPFGGIKDSGYGRELGMFGIREFVNIKTVYLK